jgi:hypothetical protein
VNGADLELWKMNFASTIAAAGAVPEPASAVAALTAAAMLHFGRKRRRTPQFT